jgi:hypothetical protein
LRFCALLELLGTSRSTTRAGCFCSRGFAGAQSSVCFLAGLPYACFRCIRSRFLSGGLALQRLDTRIQNTRAIGASARRGDGLCKLGTETSRVARGCPSSIFGMRAARPLTLERRFQRIQLYRHLTDRVFRHCAGRSLRARPHSFLLISGAHSDCERDIGLLHARLHCCSNRLGVAGTLAPLGALCCHRACLRHSGILTRSRLRRRALCRRSLGGSSQPRGFSSANCCLTARTCQLLRVLPPRGCERVVACRPGSSNGRGATFFSLRCSAPPSPFRRRTDLSTYRGNVIRSPACRRVGRAGRTLVVLSHELYARAFRCLGGDSGAAVRLITTSERSGLARACFVDNDICGCTRALRR